MTRVSILVAAFRAEKTLARAVASVFAQTESDWELIIVADDGDDYRRHLPGPHAQDPRLHFADTGTVAGGAWMARNVGLQRASGAFVAVLDADDRFAPDRLTQLGKAADANGLAADCVNVVGPSGVTLRHAFAPDTPDRSVSANEIMQCGVPLNPLVRRDLLGEGWPALGFAEDVVLNLQLLARAGCFPVVMQPLYEYVVHDGSICHGADAALHADAGYEQILAELEGRAFGLPDDLQETVRKGFLEKQANNRAFAEALGAGRAMSFQEFMAGRS